MSAFISWYEEKQSSYLYKIIAEQETAPNYKQMFQQLAQAAEEQALIWEKQMQAKNQSVPTYNPNFRTRIVAWLIKRQGAKKIRPILAAMKVRGLSIYLTSPPGHAMPTSIADIGRHHKAMNKGGNLRASVFGVNDGLISNASLIMGMAGAAVDHKIILVAGVAGLLAGAFSMAAGEYVSVRSQREMMEYQLKLEKEELELYPAEEAEELALIYHARGLPHEEARHMATTMMQDPVKALDVLAREELGINPQELGSPIGAAVSSFLSFTMGALIPLFPFLFGNHSWSLSVAIILSAIALFSVGMVTTLFTGRSALLSGLRMLIIGGVAGAATYLIGHILGVALN